MDAGLIPRTRAWARASVFGETADDVLQFYYAPSEGKGHGSRKFAWPSASTQDASPALVTGERRSISRDFNFITSNVNAMQCIYNKFWFPNGGDTTPTSLILA